MRFVVPAASSEEFGHGTRILNSAMVSTILLATDFSDSAALAHLYTEYLAVTLKASVILLHVREHSSSVKTGLNEREIETRLQTLQEKFGECAVPVTVHRSTGNPGHEILAAAHQLDADMISMGMQGRAHLPYGLIGSTAHTVTTSGPCPVLTVPLASKETSSYACSAPEGVRIQRILAPVDFSQPSLDSLEWAIHLAHRLRADLVLLHVLEPAHADWNLDRMQGAGHVREQWEARLGKLTGLMKSLGVSSPYDLRTGVPSDSILAGGLQHRCDLIVMGTHGRQGRQQGHVGSVAAGVLKQAICPVLTVKNHKLAGGIRPAIENVLSKNERDHEERRQNSNIR